MYPVSAGRNALLPDDYSERNLTQSPTLRRVRSTLASPFTLSPKAYHFSRSLLLTPRSRPQPLALLNTLYDDPEARRRDALAAAAAAYENSLAVREQKKSTVHHKIPLTLSRPSGRETRTPSTASRPKRWDGSVRSQTQTVTPVEEKILYYRRRARRGCRNPWVSKDSQASTQDGDNRFSRGSVTSFYQQGSKRGSIVNLYGSGHISPGGRGEDRDQYGNQPESAINATSGSVSRQSNYTFQTKLRSSVHSREDRHGHLSRQTMRNNQGGRETLFCRRTPSPGACLPFGVNRLARGSYPDRQLQDQCSSPQKKGISPKLKPRGLLSLTQISVKKREDKRQIETYMSVPPQLNTSSLRLNQRRDQRSGSVVTYTSVNPTDYTDPGPARESAENQPSNWRNKVKKLLLRSMASVSLRSPPMAKPMPVQQVTAARAYYGDFELLSSVKRRPGLDLPAGSPMDCEAGMDIDMDTDEINEQSGLFGWDEESETQSRASTIRQNQYNGNDFKQNSEAMDVRQLSHSQSIRTVSCKSGVTSWADSSLMESFRVDSMNGLQAGRTSYWESNDQEAEGTAGGSVKREESVGYRNCGSQKASVSGLTRALYRSLMRLKTAGSRTEETGAGAEGRAGAGTLNAKADEIAFAPSRRVRPRLDSLFHSPSPDLRKIERGLSDGADAERRDRDADSFEVASEAEHMEEKDEVDAKSALSNSFEMDGEDEDERDDIGSLKSDSTPRVDTTLGSQFGPVPESVTLTTQEEDDSTQQGTATIFETCPAVSFSLEARRRMEKEEKDGGLCRRGRTSDEWREWFDHETAELGVVPTGEFELVKKEDADKSRRGNGGGADDDFGVTSMSGRLESGGVGGAINTPESQAEDEGSGDYKSAEVVKSAESESIASDDDDTADGRGNGIEQDDDCESIRTLSAPIMNITIRRVRSHKPARASPHQETVVPVVGVEVVPDPGAELGCVAGGGGEKVGWCQSRLRSRSLSRSWGQPVQRDMLANRCTPAPTFLTDRSARNNVARSPISGRALDLTYNLHHPSGPEQEKREDWDSGSVRRRVMLRTSWIGLRSPLKENRPASPSWHSRPTFPTTTGTAGGNFSPVQRGRQIFGSQNLAPLGVQTQRTGGHKLATEFLNARKQFHSHRDELQRSFRPSAAVSCSPSPVPPPSACLFHRSGTGADEGWMGENVNANSSANGDVSVNTRYGLSRPETPMFL